MKLVREHIEKFTRGGKNPLKSLNIGKRVEINNWFETWAPDVDYEIDDDLKIHIGGYLDLYKSKVTFLPDNLHIKEDLDIEGSKIISLPDNLYVGGTLYTERTKITSLPNDLHVEGSLDLRNTNITSLPDNLHVGWKIYKDF